MIKSRRAGGAVFASTQTITEEDRERLGTVSIREGFKADYQWALGTARPVGVRIVPVNRPVNRVAKVLRWVARKHGPISYSSYALGFPIGFALSWWLS